MPRNSKDRLGEVGGYWLTQREGSTAWYRTWFDKRGRQRRRASLGTDDLEQAKLALAAWVMAHAKPEQAPPKNITLETCLVRYYEQHAKTLRSGEQARYALKKWSTFFPGALVSEVTPEKQRAFVAWLREAGLSDGYIRRTLAVGQAALNRAFREGEVTAVPTILLQLTPEGEPRERHLTCDESRALFDAATEPHQILYLVIAYGTAARPEAILQLTSFQVDCEARLIRLNPIGRAQNKKRRPTLPICDTLLPWLRGLPAGPIVQYKGKVLAGTRSMFNHLTGRIARKIRKETAAEARRYRRTGRRAAAWSLIADGKRRSAAIREVTAYTIRHTVAVEMRKRGVPVWEVAGFLGHTSGYKTTERYAKFGPDHLAGAVRAIDDYFAELGIAGLRPVAYQLRASEPQTRTLTS